MPLSAQEPGAVLSDTERQKSTLLMHPSCSCYLLPACAAAQSGSHTTHFLQVKTSLLWDGAIINPTRFKRPLESLPVIFAEFAALQYYGCNLIYIHLPTNCVILLIEIQKDMLRSTPPPLFICFNKCIT